MLLRPLFHREYVGSGPSRLGQLPGARGETSSQRAFRKSPSDHEYLVSSLRVGDFALSHDEAWDDEICPTAIKFPKYRETSHHGGRRRLAIGDEQGRVGVFTSDNGQGNAAGSSSSNGHSGWSKSSTWAAHRSYIYDLAWLSPTQLVTASGDRTLRLWDAETCEYVSTFGCHPGTVRTVSPFNENPNLFVSGCRGGLVLIWDHRAKQNPNARGPSGELCLMPSAEYDDLHCAAPKRRSGYRQPMAISSVLPTRDDRLLATASVHGEVKFWDIRVVGRKQDPVQTIPTAPFVQGMQRRPGITSLDFDPSGSKLLVSYRDADLVVYEWIHYNAKQRNPDHFRTFTGSEDRPYACSSFYIHSCFSPDGNYILSGSGAGAGEDQALIWDVYGPSPLPVAALRGHRDEVTGVHWDPSAFGTIATVSDDASARMQVFLD
ncbi:Guanine nucleotide-binding protein subunit beta-1 [Hondaea fermentalgiana]|uniref:Guanine nucleotide-binding protein subunit beta-1 n=1 Tax=Hondaea fermentalgiana TaxID=2315210 RepID=A0A2R5G4X8_9STRA|nr:Guanine nucleotide-binding protein subunit beta-1 [Hondaea fermentalgiana]|eukprot:GBG26076.1 Guanine nucleotide-binding protein subunit beta-1 [Hondaea fermentalgiana]